MNNYEEKVRYLHRKQNGICPISNRYLPSPEAILCGASPKIDLHHMVIHNTKVNRKKYPFFIDSVLNLRLVHHDAHMSNPSFGIPKGYRRADKVERLLRENEDLRKYANNPS